MSAKVSLVRTTDRAAGVKKSISLLKNNPVLGKAVVLKPNFNSADVTPGSTHIDTLRALVQELKDMGAKKITIAERSGPGLSTKEVMEKKGIFALAKEQGFEVVNLEEAGENDWVRVRPKDSHWKEGFLFPRIYADAECIVETCCLKTHQFGGHFTLSLKLAVGMVPRVGHNFMQELHGSPHQRDLIAEINAAFSPDLVVMDGVDAFIQGGPARGTLVQAGVFLASSDRVAIDAVGVAILRSHGTTPEVSRGKIFEQDQIVRAAALGLGVKSASEIQLVAGDAESEAYCKKIAEILRQG